LDTAWDQIKTCLGELPLLASEQRALDESGEEGEGLVSAKTTTAVPAARRILPDGTYATESAFVDSSRASKVEAVKAFTKPPLRGK
jgi:coatomer subunit beta